MTDQINAKSPTKSNSRSISAAFAVFGFLLSLIIGLLVTGVSNSLYLLVAVLGLIAFIVTFSKLDLGVAAMVFILYTQMYILVGERYGVTDVAQGLIMLLVLSMGVRWVVYPPEIPQGWMRPLFLVAFYCLVCFASVMFAVFPPVAMPIAIETLKSGIIAMIIAVTLKSKESFRLVIWTLLIAGIFLGTLSVIQFTLGTYTNDYGGYAYAVLSNISGDTSDYRLGGPVADPNYYAQMMLVLVPLALDRLWNEKQRLPKILAAWALGVTSLTVLLTYSRGGFIALAIIVVAMVFIFYRGQLHYLLAVAVLALLLVNILPSRFTERISTLTELVPSKSSSSIVSQDYSFRGRTSEMLVAIQMFADYPIMGVGLGNYQELYQKYAQRFGMEFRSEVRQAHNLYLEVASETGLMGLFSFMLLLIVILKSIWDGRKALLNKGLVSVSNMVTAYGLGFIGYLLAAFFIHNAYPRNFWVIAGIALAIPRMIEVEIAATDELKHKHKFLQGNGNGA
ncbi:MAG: O-antigen ligase family protein [Anaerolineales bacterium]|nr:O-antigen ligase family protein [Anaerolineales bacterium]